jgi:hypothetical protein
MPNEIHPLFNETHPYKYLVDVDTSLESLLTFVRSVNIQAFPCGRRTSATESAKQTYYFPFDPEARLNTEANNIKHSSLNGYTQTYLKDWDSNRKLLTLSLAGYLFTIALNGTYTKIEDGTTVTNTFDCSNITEFGSAVTMQLKEKADSILSSARSSVIDTEEKVAAAEALLRGITSSNCIYANILLEDVHLFSGAPKEYFTSILRDQYDTTNSDLAAENIGPNPLLDMLNKAAEDAVDIAPKLQPNNYFFSGLSFSATPLTGNTTDTRSSALHTVAREHMPGNTTTQLVVSLRILDKVKTSAEGVVPETFAWQIHQPAYLPFIEHGTTDDSIVVTGHTLLKSNLDVLGNTNVNGYIHSNSYIDADSTIHADGNITTNSNITAEGSITAKTDLDVFGESRLKTNLTVGTADNTSTGTITATKHISTPTLSAGTVNGDDINQKVNGQYYDVPVMFLDKVGSEYQLKISRVNKTF